MYFEKYLMSYLFFLLRGSLFRGSIVMLRKRLITKNVVIRVRLTTLSEIPRSLLRVVRTILKAFQFVLKVDYIVSLLIPQ